MEAEKIEDKELKNLDIKIEGRTPENYRMLKIPEKNCLNNKFYHNFTLEHYSDMLNR